MSSQHPQGGLTFPSYELCSGREGDKLTCACNPVYILLDSAGPLGDGLMTVRLP